jgi:hypothetical protein
VSQQGAEVTASGSGHTAGIPPGASVNFGFQGTLSAAHVAPEEFELNGTPCD